MGKRVLMIALCLISIAILAGVFLTNYRSSSDFVRPEDVEVHISNMEKLDGNRLYISVEIVNKSSFTMERNNIFIDKLDIKNNQPNKHQGSSDNVHSSQSIQTKRSKEASTSNAKVIGSLHQIPANDAVQLGVTFQMDETHDGSILLIFRSDQVRNEHNATKRRYTTLTKEINMNDPSFEE